MTAIGTRADVHGAHLVGIVSLPTADDDLAGAAGRLGASLPRSPDGEVGPTPAATPKRPAVQGFLAQPRLRLARNS